MKIKVKNYKSLSNLLSVEVDDENLKKWEGILGFCESKGLSREIFLGFFRIFMIESCESREDDVKLDFWFCVDLNFWVVFYENMMKETLWRFGEERENSSVGFSCF